MRLGQEFHDKLTSLGFFCANLKDADVWMHPSFIPDKAASGIQQFLIAQCPWQQPVIKMGKREIHSPRLACWHGDPEAKYTYSGLTNMPHQWNDALNEVRDKIKDELGLRFNSVLANYYRNGNDSMGWHRDNEPELGPNPVIVSVSLGGPRKFRMQHIKDKSSRWDTMLAHGSVLVMSGETQNKWRHCLPKSVVHNNTRVNLTFRQIISIDSR